jgi:hypothetical protein
MVAKWPNFSFNPGVEVRYPLPLLDIPQNNRYTATSLVSIGSAEIRIRYMKCYA